MKNDDRRFFEELRGFFQHELSDSDLSFLMSLISRRLVRLRNYIIGMDLADAGSDYGVEITWDAAENKIIKQKII